MSTPPERESWPNDTRLPIPDPTALTEAFALRETAHLKEALSLEIAALEERVDAYEAAHNARHHDRAKEVATEILHLTELAAERFAGVTDRFASIQLQLTERDERVKESSQASKDAIAAALANQKEAAAKAEMAVKEQILSLKTEMSTTIASLESKIDNVKELVTTTQLATGRHLGRDIGLDTAVTRTLMAAGVIVAIVVAVLAYMAPARGG